MAEAIPHNCSFQVCVRSLHAPVPRSLIQETQDSFARVYRRASHE